MLTVSARDPAAAMVIRTEERDFFVAMGVCIAALHRFGTVVQVALAETLAVSLDELLGSEAQASR